MLNSPLLDEYEATDTFTQPQPVKPARLIPFLARSRRQHCKFAEVALSAVIAQRDSILFDTIDVVKKAWDTADEMVNEANRRGIS
jgi:hypothetical protein